MNDFELAIPQAFEQYPPEYSGESVWKPLEHTSERTYLSSFNNFDLAVKWPSMENRDQNNNLSSYNARKDINGEKDWISIEVVSRLANWPNEKKIQYIKQNKDIKSHDYAYFLSKYLDGTYFHLSPGNEMQQKGIDINTGLHLAKIEGPDADKPVLGNNFIYWNVNSYGLVTALIECPAGKLQPKFEQSKVCLQRYDLPELHAEVRVYYHMQLLPNWRQIQEQSRTLILSFKH